MKITNQFCFYVKPCINLKVALDEFVESQQVLTVEDWDTQLISKRTCITITPYFDECHNHSKVEFATEFEHYLAKYKK